MFAPAKTPRPIVEQLHAEVAKALADSAVKEKLAKLGVQPLPKTDSNSTIMCAWSSSRTRRLVKAAGIKVQ